MLDIVSDLKLFEFEMWLVLMMFAYLECLS